jgi:hypothetical protein
MLSLNFIFFNKDYFIFFQDIPKHTVFLTSEFIFVLQLNEGKVILQRHFTSCWHCNKFLCPFLQ